MMYLIITDQKLALYDYKKSGFNVRIKLFIKLLIKLACW